MSDDFDFVDELMSKAFSMLAPKMPDFTEKNNEGSAEIIEFMPKRKAPRFEECSLDDLDLLNAAGQKVDIDDIDKD